MRTTTSDAFISLVYSLLRLAAIIAPIVADDTLADPLRAKEVVVTANRDETPVDQLTKSVTVQDRDIIDLRSDRNITDALRDVPGVDIAVAGGQSGVGSIFIRGANAEHSLVLYNGIEINNPINNVRGVNLSTFTLDDVDRIEIVRGPGSTAWGSDALGGVINIITKDPKPGISSSVSLEGGNYDTVRGAAGLGIGESNYGLTIEASSRYTGGLSQAASSLGNSEKDYFQQNGFSGRGFVQLDPDLRVSLFGAGQSGRADIDASGGAGGDDPNRIFLSDTLVTGGEANLKWLDQRIDSALGFGYTSQTFDDNNDPDAARPLDRLRSSFEGSLIKGYLRNTIHIAQASSVLLGAEVESEEGESSYRSTSAFGPYDDYFPNRSLATVGLFTTSTLQLLDSLVASVGGRFDDQDIFGSRETWSVGLRQSVNFGSTKAAILGNIGTGYKAPSIYQFYSAFGSRDLRPEKSLGWDIGLEQSFDSLTVTTTYFENHFDNLINFDPSTFIFSNITSANTRGVESSIKYPVSSFVAALVSYTYTDTKDDSTGLSLLRRARNKANLGVELQPTQGIRSSLFWTLVGSRSDLDYSTGSPARVTLGSYSLLGASLAVEITKNYELFARLDNILNQTYQQVAGYGTMGRNGVVGIKGMF